MAGVYISYPFCAQKCTYCNFATDVFAQSPWQGGWAPPAQKPRSIANGNAVNRVLTESLADKYLVALRTEIERHEWMWRPETLYLGGGTPGNLETGGLGDLLSAVPGAPWGEATIEAAPGSITALKAQAWKALGINRVSLGVQSFVTRELTRTGRRHDAETVAREVAILRGAGIDNFNIDLIAGLPGQTREGWLESLQWIARLEAPHVSVYMLEIDEDSRLGKEILHGGARYGAADVPSEDAIVDSYESAVEQLGRLGLRRYEVSNFARPGLESRHNLKYWRLEPYAGFGSDAHSFDGAIRSQNVESPAEYVARMERGESPQAEARAADIGEEKFFVGLRLSEGVRMLPQERSRFAAPIQRFCEAGLLELEDQTLRLTAKGILLSNEVFQEFITI